MGAPSAVRADLGTVSQEYFIEVANKVCDREPRAAVLLFVRDKTACFVKRAS